MKITEKYLGSKNFSPEFILISMILFLALFFRIYGINHGLPYSYYSDESRFMHRALAFGSGDLNPHWFHKPALLMYLLFFEYGAWYALGKLLGVFHSVDDFARLYLADKTVFILLGRMTSALFGTATVYLTYLVGKRMFNQKVGLLAGLFMAFNAANVEYSHDIGADVPCAFFTILAFTYVHMIMARGTTKDYLLAGFMSGLGTATKYYTILMIVPIFIAHCLRIYSLDKSRIREFLSYKPWLSFVALIGGFFIGSPYNFLDPGARNEFLLRVKNTVTGANLSGTDLSGKITDASGDVSGVSSGVITFVNSIYDIFKVILQDRSMGIFIGILSLIGITYVIYQYKRKQLLLLAAFPIFFIIIASLFAPFYAKSRHLSSIYPFLSVIAAVLAFDMIGLLFKSKMLKSYAGFKNFAFACAAIALVMPSLVFVAKCDYLISHKDTRNIAKEWIEENIPQGSKIILSEQGPKLNMNEKNLKHLYSLALKESEGPYTTHLSRYYKYQLDIARNMKSYDITMIRYPWWQEEEKQSGLYYADSELDKDMQNPLNPVGVMPLSYYKDNGYQYAIVSSGAYEEFLNGSLRFPSFIRFYEELFKEGILIKEFKPNPINRPGPVIKIFRLQ